jgi:drug/metabolite transporter (DMT)-like permease
MTSSNTAPRWLVIAAFAAVYTIWGSTYLAIAWGIKTISPYLMVAVRFVIAGGVMTAWGLATGARFKLVHWRSAAIIGGLLLIGGNASVVWAEQFVPSGIAALIIATVPLWMGLLDWIRPGGSRPSWGIIAGLLVGFAGTAYLINPFQTTGEPVNLVGALALVGAALLWATGSLYSRTKHAQLPESPILSTGMEMAAAGVMLTVIAIVNGEAARFDIAQVTLQSWIALGYLITFGSIVGFTAYVWLLKVSTPARASTYAYVNPVVAVALGALLNGETLTPQMLIATPIILAGVILITSQRGKAKPVEAEAEPQVVTLVGEPRVRPGESPVYK